VVLDQAVLRFLSEFHGRWHFFDSVFLFSHNADLIKGAVMCFYWWVFFSAEDSQQRLDEKRSKLVTGLVASLFAVLIARLMADLLPFRDRPLFSPDFQLSWARLEDKNYQAWSAFPSDHAAMFMGIAVSILSVSRKIGWLVVAYVAIFVCFCRVYLGIHWFTDVVVGSLLGAACVLAAHTRVIQDRVWFLAMKWWNASPGSMAAFATFLTASIWTIFGDVLGIAHAVWAVITHAHGAT